MLPWLLALGAGVSQAVSLATPWDGQPLWWLQVLAQTVFARLLLDTRSVRQAAMLGGCFATAWLAATFGWLYTSMHVYGGLAAPLAVVAVLALAAFLALYWAGATALWARCSHHQRWHHQWPSVPLPLMQSVLSAIVFGATCLLAELARTQWFTGFPWGGAAYAHGDGPLAAYAPWVGVYGMAFVASVVAMLLAQALRQAQARPSGLPPLWPLTAVLLMAGLTPAGLNHWNAARQTDPSGSAGTLTLALLQGNIAQEEKFQQSTGVPMALQWYDSALRSAKGSLIVAPETALPLLPQDMPAGYWDRLQTHFSAPPASGKHPQAALIGTPLGDLSSGYTNSVRGLAPGQYPPYQYDKHHLVPFGEFIPPLFRWFTDLMHIPLGDFNRGGLAQPPFVWQGQRIAPNICYEDLFGEEFATRFRDPAAAPTVFVNVSNLAWFGDGQAIDQHLQISRLRALEFERPMVRATNTGATVVIDHRGRITAALPRSTRSILEADVEGRATVTPYAALTARWGLWPWWVGCLVVLLWSSRSKPVVQNKSATEHV